MPSSPGPRLAGSGEPRRDTGHRLVVGILLQPLAGLTEHQAPAEGSGPQRLPPAEAARVEGVVLDQHQQIMGQVLGALKVFDVDKGFGWQELFTVPPAGAQHHWHCPGVQGVPPQLLWDTVRVQGVLESQVKLVLGQPVGHDLLGQWHVGASIHIHLEVRLQLLLVLYPDQVRPPVGHHPGHQLGLGRDVHQCVHRLARPWLKLAVWREDI